MTKKHTDIREKIGGLIPQTHCQTGCDGFGTYPEADEDGDATPAQCQYCYETRLPLIDKLVDVSDQQSLALLDRVEKRTPTMLTEELFEEIKEKYPELDKTDYFHFALDKSIEVINQERDKLKSNGGSDA